MAKLQVKTRKEGKKYSVRIILGFSPMNSCLFQPSEIETGFSFLNSIKLKCNLRSKTNFKILIKRISILVLFLFWPTICISHS